MAAIFVAGISGACTVLVRATVEGIGDADDGSGTDI